MTITQLQYVLAIAEYRNFTVAAEKCFVTQPTMSMQVQKLEEELDVQIFDRKKKPIELTGVGKKIIEQARNIVNESYRIKDIVDQQKGFIGGEFRLGIIPTVTPTLLPMFLKLFLKKYPNVQLKIEEINTSQIIKKLKEGHLDAAIAVTPLEVPELKERVLYYEPFVCYIPKDHRLFAKKKINTDDLDIHELLLLEDGHCFRNGVVNLCPSSQKNREKLQLESGSFETLIKLTNEGLGMTLLPFLHTLDIKADAQSQLRFFEEPSPARAVSLVYHESELKSHITDALRDVIVGVVKGAIAFHDVKIISPLKNKSLN
jgi:LysR family hydrogen peroxide-inducible transcriptional activator